MASHSELRPDDASLPLLIASAALSKAESRLTVATGTVVADNADGTQTWIGSNGSDDTNGVIKWVGDLSAPGRPSGLSAACSMQCVVVSWDGTLENGVPSDFAYIEVFARREGSVDDVVSWGRLSSAGMLMSPRYEIGTVFDVYAIAYDDAHDSTGASARNQSEQSDLITVAVEQDADMEQIDAAVEEMSKKADEAGAKAEQVRKDMQSEVDSVKADAASLSQTVEQNRSDLEQKVNDVNSSLTAKLDSATADLDKSVQEVDSKADAAKAAAAEAQSKAESVESDLDSANATIERHSAKLGELTTKVTNAGTKADSAVSVATEAKQTATEASTKATSAYADSQTALTQSTTATQTATSAKTTAESASKTANDSLKQSSTAVQTANQVSTKLTTEYQTKADADKVYATQSSVTQTSDSIRSEVAKTYATKDALTALQNVADNAIESWRGSGVPTLSNKPASDWTTDAERKKHSGDLYYDKATGKAYRFGSDDGTTYSWELNQDSDVTKALQDASKAQTSANAAQSTADKATTAAGKAQSTANTAVSNAATAKSAADAAQTSANAAQSDVDKLKVDIPATYATKSSVEQTASEITASVESVKTTANGAVTAASKAQQTADSINVNLTKNYQTKANADATYATQANLKATSDSLTASVSKAQSTADGAVTSASKAQQTADAVTLNLSKNYQTKAQNDSTYATQSSLKATSDGLTAKITANASKAQSALDKATTVEANLNGFKTTVSETYTTKTDFNNLSIGGTNRIVLTGGSKGRIDSSRSNGQYDADSHWTSAFVAAEPSTAYLLHSDLKVDANTYVSVAFYDADKKFISRPTGALTNLTAPWTKTVSAPATAVYMRASFPNAQKGHIKLEKGTKPTDWSPAPEDLQAAGDYATNSSLTQTANSITAKVNEVANTASGAMSKATSVEQTASSLSTKISEQATTLNATVKTANEAKSTADSNKTTISQVSTTASNALNKATTVEANLNGFKTTVSKTYQTKTDMSSYSTKSYVDETSKSVALGVVQDYKGADGSGLATKSDISVSKTEITSEVSSKYATKDGVSKEISSKITQNNSSWELKFATKTEAKSAQDAANAANTVAADAQSRVGNLEPCIRMTSDGVRVGKQANGAYQGTSALVGTDGTFDVLDSSAKRLLEVGSSGVKFPKSSDGHQLALGYVTDSATKTDTLYIGDIISGQQEGGPKNRLGFTGSQVSLEGGDIGISANDNQLSLYGHKGANLLVPSGGNVQVGGQAGSSSTTLTLRGSTVNLYGDLVKVNGRTLNEPVDAKQSQKWNNIQLDVKCVNRVVTVNVLHPLGSNAVVGDQSDQCEIGYIKEGYRPSRMIGCHLAAYNTTNLFLEINPSTGKVACFRLWGNQNTWAYFSASLSYVI